MITIPEGKYCIDKYEWPKPVAKFVSNFAYPIRDEVERRGRYFFQKPFRNNDLYEIIKKGAIISCFA